MSTRSTYRPDSLTAAIGKLMLMGIVLLVALPGHVAYAEFNDCPEFSQSLLNSAIALESDPVDFTGHYPQIVTSDADGR